MPPGWGPPTAPPPPRPTPRVRGGLTSARARAEKGVSSAGFTTTVQPAARAAPTLRVIMALGKFHCRQRGGGEHAAGGWPTHRGQGTGGVGWPPPLSAHTVSPRGWGQTPTDGVWLQNLKQRGYPHQVSADQSLFLALWGTQVPPKHSAPWL